MSDKEHKRSENSPSREQGDSGEKHESQVVEHENRAQRDGDNETGNMDLGFQTQDGGISNGPELEVYLPMVGTESFFSVQSIHESLLSSSDDDGDLMVTDLAISDENPDLGDKIHVDHGDLPIQETEEGRILSLQSAEFGVNGDLPIQETEEGRILSLQSAEFGVNDQIMVYDPGAHLALVTSIDASSANAEL